MAFIRRKGRSYYLLHNVRHKGRVQQLYLARLGPWPRINEDVVRGVNAKHPFLRLDWDRLKERISGGLIQPFQNHAEYLRQLLENIRNVNLDIAELNLPTLELTSDRELLPQFLMRLKLLRATLDVKLNPLRRGKPHSLRS